MNEQAKKELVEALHQGIADMEDYYCEVKEFIDQGQYEVLKMPELLKKGLKVMEAVGKPYDKIWREK